MLHRNWGFCNQNISGFTWGKMYSWRHRYYWSLRAFYEPVLQEKSRNLLRKFHFWHVTEGQSLQISDDCTFHLFLTNPAHFSGAAKDVFGIPFKALHIPRFIACEDDWHGRTPGGLLFYPTVNDFCQQLWDFISANTDEDFVLLLKNVFFLDHCK